MEPQTCYGMAVHELHRVDTQDGGVQDEHYMGAAMELVDASSSTKNKANNIVGLLAIRFLVTFSMLTYTVVDSS